MAALYSRAVHELGITPAELRSGKPIVGIGESGATPTPCNRDPSPSSPSGSARESAMPAGSRWSSRSTPIFENCRRPTAAPGPQPQPISGLVEILDGYPIDAVVLTTGCDKTTPAGVMAAATVDIPAIMLSGGPMLDGWHEGELVGSGTVIWRARRSAGRRRDRRGGVPAPRRRFGAVARPLQHDGHRLDDERGRRGAWDVAARMRGHPRAVSRARRRWPMRPAGGSSTWPMRTSGPRRSSPATRSSTPIRLISAIGGSTERPAPPHRDGAPCRGRAQPRGLDDHGYDLPLLVDMQPAGDFLGERFHRAGGVPAVLWELLQAGRLTATA